jgi:hypothetical protein
MLKRMRSTIVLLIVFVGLFTYFWFFQKGKKPPEDKPETPKVETVKLTNYNAKDLATIEWKYGSVSASLGRQDNDWKLPDISVKTDMEKSASYVTSATALNGQYKYSTKDITPEDAGLTTPTLQVVFKKNDGGQEVVKVGKKAIGDEYYYANKEGSNEVTLLPSYTVEELMHDPTYFYYVATPSPAPSGQ